MNTTTTLHRLFITDDLGRRHQTRYLMSEADALATDPTAEPVPGSIEIRHRPACMHDHVRRGAHWDAGEDPGASRVRHLGRR